MIQPRYTVVDESPWRKAKYACDYFQVSRAQLERLAVLAGARRKIGSSVRYDIKMIESYMRNQL